MPLILVVDDVDYERRRIREVLEPAGYDIVEAENGLEALEQFEKFKPDCILSDLVMPQMDGFEFLDRLGKRGNRNPVLVLTSNCMQETAEHCFRLGAVAVLHKPWEADKLLEEVRKVLRTRLRASG